MTNKTKCDTGAEEILQKGAEILENNVYAQKIIDELNSNKLTLCFSSKAPALQGSLLVYFSILLSAFKYFIDLKQNKAFTHVQKRAFHFLREDVREYARLLPPALKNLDTIFPYYGYDLFGNYANMHYVYRPLVKLSRTYLPYLGWERGKYDGKTYQEHFYSCGSLGEGLERLNKYCRHPNQYQPQINQNKQPIMRELGKEIKEFYSISSGCAGHSDDFFYWFGYAMNDLWRGASMNFPYDVSSRVTELLMATKNMGDEYFNREYAEFYIRMLDNSDFRPITSCEKLEYSKVCNTLLGNAAVNDNVLHR